MRWKWNSAETAYIKDDLGNTVQTVEFDAKGVHVGDAAQLQFGGSVKYNFVKNFYIKLQSLYFGNYYADFDPLSLQDLNKGHDSWKIPAYTLIDINAGYNFELWKTNMRLNFNIKNLLDTDYISDAVNNDQYLANNPKTFDAKSSTVFMGLGRMYSASIKVKF